ncbi:MAG: hypothetical protein LJF06_15575 [Gemmatimonadetes bacterium]|nr:hypothetical protein [Gemmatimonadota bacterium]
MPHASRRPSSVLLGSTIVGAAAVLSLAMPRSAFAAPRQTVPPDSSALVKEAHKRQSDFELFRQSRIPVVREGAGHRCDANIGRMCIWFGGEEETDFPPEAPEVSQARIQLIDFLSDAAKKIHDPWITGQLVVYLVEAHRYPEAERVARSCRLTESWWCSALLGYVLHLEHEYISAQAAFDHAAATLPKKEREKWLTPLYIFTDKAEKQFKKGKPAEQAREWALLWRLSDPLYLVPGNDRLTDHFARWVEAYNEQDAANPQGLLWADDLEETLIRYGRDIGWSRTFNPAASARMGFQGRVLDTRQVVGHQDPHSRGYLFPEEYLKSPSDIPPESWITAPRDSRTWYAPPYAPDFRELESQVGRFRRGDSMMVVGAYEPAPPKAADEDVGAPAGTGDSPMPSLGPVQSGLFLIPVDSGTEAEVHDSAVAVRGTDAAGVFTLKAPPGRYVSSLEVFDPSQKRAWRARQGVRQDPLMPGLVAVSDLMILDKGAPFPSSLQDAIPYIRRNVRVKRGEKFTVVWEAYGVGVKQPAQVTLGFTEGLPGFLTRVGKFLGILKPDRPVQISFSEANFNQEQTLFRAVNIQLPDLEPGEYTLHLRVDLPGRTPAIVNRPIVVEE